MGSAASSVKLSSNVPKAVVVCVIFSIFQQLTGLNGIIFYSSQIFGSSDQEDF